MEGVLGPVDRPVVYDEFNFEQVKGVECLGQVCRKVCKSLKKSLGKERRKFLCVCIPCYNESVDDLMKTIASIMENVDFMKHKTRFNDDEVGDILKKDFDELQTVIVPIFDGISAMDPSVREWLNEDMPEALADLDGPGGPGKVQVRVCSARWWYYCWDTLRKESISEPDHEVTGDHSGLVKSLLRASDLRGSAGHRKSDVESTLSDVESLESYIHFQLVPMIKRTNHRKHNSHHWFFQGICVGLNASLVFLTDCGTTFHETCVARLVYALRCKRDLIGVTARQRVETPNANYHPCEKTKLPFLQGEHEGIGSHPCWKCYLAYYLSPAPLQGFEFEATLILNSALFNLVEAMPVLPGPCQVLDWPRMRQHRVVEEYFDLLFNEDTAVTGAASVRDRPLPKGHRNSRRPKRGKSSSGSFNTSRGVSSEPRAESSLEGRPMPTPDAKQRPRLPQGCVSPPASDDSIDTSVVDAAFEPKCVRIREDDDSDLDIDELNMRSSVAAVARERSSLNATDVAAIVEGGAAGIVTPPHVEDMMMMSFTEFLRVNMRLAEDRVLSFVTVFSTGFGTKWIPGATFYYEPEVTFGSLLTQRRRWINGTVASFMYFFSSKRARLRVSGGFFDSHKAGKSLRLVNMLWALNLLQFVFVLISPSVFAVALYNGLKNGAKFSPLMQWTHHVLFTIGGTLDVDVTMAVVVVYLLVYIVWTLNAYRAPRGRIQEWQCGVMVAAAFLAIFPVYFALIASAVVQPGTVHYIVMASVLGPVAIALSQSATSALLYTLYLPWFLCLAVFFLVYVPSYSFARLWDTTWGNRDTSRDDSIDLRREKAMKFYVLIFIISLIVFNCVFTLTLCIVLTVNAQLIFMVILFSPTIIQIVGSVVFLLIVVPLRGLSKRSKDDQLLMAALPFDQPQLLVQQQHIDSK